MASELAASPGFTNMGKKTIVRERVTKYVGELFEQGKEETERERNRRKRLQMAKEIAENYYTLVTDFFEYGYGQSFHFAPIYDDKTMAENIAEYQRSIARSVKAGLGMKILDVGCGVGGPTREVAKFSGAQVVGLNCCDYQLKRAKMHTELAQLDDLVSYVKGDFCNMEFEDNSFDGAYCFEATCHATDLVRVYSEILRVLKPGAIFVDSAWAMTDSFDPENQEHLQIKDDIEIGDGVADLRTEKVILAAVRKAGLEVIEFKNVHNDGDLPWYTFLVGKSCCSLQSFRVSSVGRSTTHAIFSIMETMRMAPEGTTAVHSLLKTAADALIEGGKRDIFTPNFRIVCRKPLDSQ